MLYGRSVAIGSRQSTYFFGWHMHASLKSFRVPVQTWDPDCLRLDDFVVCSTLPYHYKGTGLNGLVFATHVFSRSCLVCRRHLVVTVWRTCHICQLLEADVISSHEQQTQQSPACARRPY